MKLNRKWLMIIALVTSLTMAISGTLAYLTDRDTVQNTFTMGNVSIQLVEKFTDGVLIKPGETVEKVASIKNDGSKAAWVWMTVSVPKGLADYVKPTWGAGYKPLYEKPTIMGEQAMWTVLVQNQLAVGGETENILNSVTLSPLVDYQNSKYVVVVDGKTTALEGIENGKLKVTVTAYAVQTDGLDKAEKAYNAYYAQWGLEPESFVVESGTSGGIDWTLTNTGKLTISPSDNPVPDANSGKTFESGQWREAVVYTTNGGASAIGGYFCDVKAVKSLVIEEGVTSIGSFAAKFPNLTGEVVIPSTVTYIGQEAFQGAPITKLTFAEGGTTEPLCIGPGAFKAMAIEELVLPADRPSIEIHCWAFNGCSKLKDVTLPSNITAFAGWTHAEYYGMDWVYSQYRYASEIFSNCKALKSITFGSQAVYDRFCNASGNKATISGLKVTIK